jgi:hypothetical protein
MEKQGYIYIFSNIAYQGKYKIGFTTNHPECRAKQMGTGHITDFVVEWFKKIKSPSKVESRIHKILDKYRVENNKEFFEASLSTLKKHINKELKTIDEELSMFGETIFSSKKSSNEEVDQKSKEETNQDSKEETKQKSRKKKEVDQRSKEETNQNSKKSKKIKQTS